MRKSKNKIFAAFKGREIGFFEEWDDCKEATSGFKGVKGVIFKGFKEKKEAEDFLTENAEQVATINDLPKENQYDKIGIVGKVKRTVRKNAQFDIGIVDQKLQLSVELEDYTGSIEVPVVDKAFEFIFDEEISEECLQEKKQLRKTLRPKTQMAKRRLKAFFGFICLRRRDFDGNYELYKFCAFEEFDDRLESICRQEEEEIEEENIGGISKRNPTDSEPIDNSNVIKRERSFLKRALEDDYSPQELPPPPKLRKLSLENAQTGFGLYECEYHRPPRKWHSFKAAFNKFQYCKKCTMKKEIYPYYIGPVPSEWSFVYNRIGQHDADNCEKCLKGEICVTTTRTHG